MSDSFTFGIELEFLVVYRFKAFNDSYLGLVPNRDEEDYEDGIISASHAIHFILEQQSDVPVEGWNTGFTRATYQRWHIHADSNELTSAEQRVLPTGYIKESVEISSRKLRFAEDWEAELNQLLKVLQQFRKYFGCELITNKTTGLHVHIGNENGHELLTVKRMAQVATALERCLDQLHNTDRIVPLDAQPNADQHNNVGQPLFAAMSFFHLSSRYERTTGYVLDWIKEIEKKRSFKELGDLCRVPFQGRQLHGHCSALNLDNLYPDRTYNPPPPPTGTIEFRQHAGTLDSAEIVAYIGFLAYLTVFCEEASDIEFVALMAHSLDMNFDLPDLLNLIQCEDDVVDHFSNPRALTLPSPGNPELRPLLEVNNRETVLRMDPGNVHAVIDEKINAGLYGVDLNPDSCVTIPLGPFHFNWMLACAKADADVVQLQAPHIDVDSYARQIVFAKLANIYANLDANSDDNSINISQQAVQDELMPWVNRYGDPGPGPAQ